MPGFGPEKEISTHTLVNPTDAVPEIVRLVQQHPASLQVEKSPDMYQRYTSLLPENAHLCEKLQTLAATPIDDRTTLLDLVNTTGQFVLCDRNKPRPVHLVYQKSPQPGWYIKDIYGREKGAWDLSTAQIYARNNQMRLYMRAPLFEQVSLFQQSVSKQQLEEYREHPFIFPAPIEKSPEEIQYDRICGVFRILSILLKKSQDTRNPYTAHAGFNEKEKYYTLDIYKLSVKDYQMIETLLEQSFPNSKRNKDIRNARTITIETIRWRDELVNYLSEFVTTWAKDDEGKQAFLVQAEKDKTGVPPRSLIFIPMENTNSITKEVIDYTLLISFDHNG